MQMQEIITENGKDYLVLALPTLQELFEYGFVSKSGKSFVFREWNYTKTVMLGYQFVKLNPALIKGRIINSHNHFHKRNITTHYFGNFGLPAIKIYLSKKLNPSQ